MRTAALYDIHGNLPALQAVLADVRRAAVDQVIVGGDVLPGPMPRETLACLLDLDIPAQFIFGNGDREVLAVMAGIETEWYRAAREEWREPVRWTARELDLDHRRLLESWPATLGVEISELGDVIFCHATLRNDTDVFTRLTAQDRVLPMFAGAAAPVIVCGHTHMQFDRPFGHIRVVNAGSVGMPFGDPGAYWLLLGPDIELQCTRYDFAKAADVIRRTKYPQAEHFAACNILQPPSEEDMLKAFSS
jgi:predicted phosphodiesterase